MDLKTLSNIMLFLSKYKQGDIIYPDVLYRNFKIYPHNADWILKACEKCGLIKKKIMLRCSNCHHHNGKLYDSYKNIPEYIVCENCDKELEKDLYSTEEVYKVN